MARCPLTKQKREKTKTTRQIKLSASVACRLFRRSYDAVIRAFDEVGNVIEAHEQPRQFKALEMRIAISTNR
jgi:hypothetical protein